MRLDRKKLVIAMLDKEINTTQLAIKAGLSRATVSSIKCGKSCSYETLEKISRALEVKKTEILED